MAVVEGFDIHLGDVPNGVVAHETAAGIAHSPSYGYPQRYGAEAVCCTTDAPVCATPDRRYQRANLVELSQ